jgi:hypothetical protein
MSPGPNYFDVPRVKSGPWQEHEKDIEERTGDRRTRGSGAGHGKTGQSSQWRRGGVSVGDNMGTTHVREGKLFHGADFKIRAHWLPKIIDQSLAMNRRPTLELRLLEPEFPVPADWVFLPRIDYEDLGGVEPDIQHSSRGAGTTVRSDCLTQVLQRTPVALLVTLANARSPVPVEWVLMPAANYDELERSDASG